MRTIRITVEYDGTNYCGWQIQPNGPTIQQELEIALHKLTGQTIRVHGAGRTDAGVHARGQVAAFQTEASIPIDRFALALNSRLPEDISVRDAAEAEAGFDPRRQAKRKLYRYTIFNSPIRPALQRHYAWHIKWPLHHGAMQEAARALVGEHDFTTFSQQSCNQDDADNIRTIDRAELLIDGEMLHFEVEGRSFLYNMVRNLTGFLVDVGLGHFTADDLPRLFAARDRQAAGQGAPACGLCLEWIRYGEHEG